MGADVAAEGTGGVVTEDVILRHGGGSTESTGDVMGVCILGGILGNVNLVAHIAAGRTVDTMGAVGVGGVVGGMVQSTIGTEDTDGLEGESVPVHQVSDFVSVVMGQHQVEVLCITAVFEFVVHIREGIAIKINIVLRQPDQFFHGFAGLKGILADLGNIFANGHRFQCITPLKCLRTNGRHLVRNYNVHQADTLIKG